MAPSLLSIIFSFGAILSNHHKIQVPLNQKHVWGDQAMQMYGTVLWFVMHLLFFVCALFMFVLQLQHLSIYNINFKFWQWKTCSFGAYKGWSPTQYPVPSYGDHFVNHPCGFLFNNQDSLPESVLRQSGVSGNVSSKEVFWAYGSHVDQKSSKWLTCWKLTNVHWKFMVGRCFISF